MTRRSWPIGADDRPQSRSALSLADRKTLREWLRNSVLSWTGAADNGELATAFAPLVLSPLEPARQVGDWATGIPATTRSNLELALAEAIEAWDPGRNARATILLVKLASYLGGPSVAASLLSILGKAIGGTDIERRDLAEAMAFFGRQHATSQEARDLAYRLRDAGLLVPTAAIVLLARAAKNYGAEIVGDLQILSSDVVITDPYADPREITALRRYCANMLVDSLGAPAAFKLALQAQANGAPELLESMNRFRLEARLVSDTDFELRDRLTSLAYRLDASDIPKPIRRTPASIATNDKLLAARSIESFLRGRQAR